MPHRLQALRISPLVSPPHSTDSKDNNDDTSSPFGSESDTVRNFHLIPIQSIHLRWTCSQGISKKKRTQTLCHSLCLRLSHGVAGLSPPSTSYSEPAGSQSLDFELFEPTGGLGGGEGLKVQVRPRHATTNQLVQISPARLQIHVRIFLNNRVHG